MLCKELEANFLNRALAVIGRTGTAAVYVNREIKHKACCLNCDRSYVKKDDAWENETCLLFVHKIPFASNKQIETLNEYLNLLCDKSIYH